MQSPLEQKLVDTLGTLLSLAEMELLIDVLENHPYEFYEGVCSEYSRLYPEDAKEMFGDTVPPKEER